MLKQKRVYKHKRSRKNISGTEERPRLSVYRSAQHIYAQIIDDTKGITLAAATDAGIKTGTKTEKAMQVGENLAKIAISAKFSKIVFDRGGFIFHGRIKALAEGLRKGGLEF